MSITQVSVQVCETEKKTIDTSEKQPAGFKDYESTKAYAKHG